MSTSVVYRISVHATAETAKPTAPALGANLDYATLNAAGWVCIGSVARGDDADIDSEGVEMTMLHEGVVVRPPGALTSDRYITRHAAIDEVTFTAYDITEDVFTLDSNMSVTAHVGERTTTQTNRAMIIERDGILFDYFPNVVLHVVGEPGGFGPGDDAVSKCNFRAKVLSTDTLPSGQQTDWYQSGT